MTREDFMKRIELGKQSSMMIWYPKLKDLPIPKIKTKIIDIGNNILSDLIRNDKPLPEKYWNLIFDAVNSIGSYPIFIRTDQASMKHSWENTCFVESKEKLKHNLFMLLEEHEMANMAGELTYDAIVVREFIELETAFTCFHSLFPVNKEVRCFINNGKFQDMRHYWVKDAIRQGQPHDVNWEEKLTLLKNLTKNDIEEIKEQILEVCKVFKEYWSVDFAKSKEGIWYLIDMARGEVSYQSDEIISTQPFHSNVMGEKKDA